MSPDPYGQYYDKYLGMGNNPINGIDPDGGFFKGLTGWYVRQAQNQIKAGEQVIRAFANKKKPQSYYDSDSYLQTSFLASYMENPLKLTPPKRKFLTLHFQVKISIFNQAKKLKT